MTGPDRAVKPGPRRRYRRGPLARSRVLRGLVGTVTLTALAEAGVRLAPVDTDYIPPPSTLIVRAAGLLADKGFLADLAATVYVWVAGLALAAVIAIPGGLVLGSVPTVRAATRSLVEFLRPVPPVALLPLAILVFAGETRMKLALTAYGALWPILFNTVYALADVDPVKVDTARVFGYGRLAVLRRICLPAAAPFIATGVRVSSSIALILAVSSGLMAGGRTGVGVFLIQASTGAQTNALVLAAVGLTGVLGYVGNETLERAESRVFRWHLQSSGAGG